MNLPPNILNAVQVWDSWAESRKRNADDPVIPLCKDLQTIGPQQFSTIISKFVMEVKVKKKPLSKYITRILSNIQQYLDKQENSNALFGNYELFNSRVKEIIAQRIAIKYNFLSESTEKQLWHDAVMDHKSNGGLSYAIFFYNVKIFGITSARDHQNLKPHFFTFSENAHGQYVWLNCTMLSSYETITSLTNKGNTPCKIIHYEDPENPRSYYKLLKRYLDAIAKNDKSNFYFKPCSKNRNGFTDEAFGKKSIASCICEMMRTAGYRNQYNNQSLRPLMDFGGKDAKSVCNGYEYMCFARRTYYTHRILKEISKKLDPPMPPEPLDPVVTLASLAPTSTEEDRTVPQQHKILKSRHAPPKSLNPPPQKWLRIEEPSCTNLSRDLEVPPVKTKDPNQSGGVTVKTEVSDYNNNPEATSQECFLLDTSPQCHLRTTVDVHHGSFNFRLAELLPPGAKDVCIEGTKSDTEEQILLNIDFRVG
ncbi:uncharacterized protein LOC134245221 [Saccostrea cucullata]|uniref:uncharacterized protein LOC134245221 n=1 Tax=Saccostrea cuccullata TaxID=36930 RepID=UPI002ED4C5F2